MPKYRVKKKKVAEVENSTSGDHCSFNQDLS